MYYKEEIVLKSKHQGRPFLVDIRSYHETSDQPVILFLHGFKGFKDAMHFNLIADQISQAGFTFIKMNFSHNGTTPDQPLDFADLEAFGENNFNKEVDDIDTVLDFIESTAFKAPGDSSHIILIGHSRGGGISFIKASEDNRVKQLVSWAAVPDFAKVWNQEMLDYWKEVGTIYVENKRTKQQMPLKYQLAEDYLQQGERFKITSCVQKLSIPALAIHGDEDETVPVSALETLKKANSKIQTQIINGANHTFGGKHPWTESVLPEHSDLLVQHTINFLKKTS